MKTILVCGPWGSGTTAVAGVLDRLGATGLPPYFMTKDSSTPNSYESIPFRETIRQYANEPSLSLVSCAPGAVQSGLRSLQQRIEQQEFGPYDPRSPKRIFFKYPLSALLIPQICEVFDTKLIYVMRPLEDIERTRLRRDWLPHFGSAGAARIYQCMAEAQQDHGHRILTINYADLLASPMRLVREMAQFADLEPSSAALGQAVDFVTTAHGRSRREPPAPKPSAGSARTRRQKICLCMIVKDEAPVIQRCLASVRPVIDHWVIVDTGSTDGTQAVIQKYYHDIPGELHQRPWVDFAHNRSEALTLARARGDYTFMIDADDVLELPPGFKRPFLNADSYTVEILNKGRRYSRPGLLRSSLPWRYEGVLHEFLSLEGDRNRPRVFAENRSQKRLSGVRIRMSEEGARRRQSAAERYGRDAVVLENALETETDPFLRARYTFYLAQSYLDAGRKEKALAAYQDRATLGFWDQEVFISLYRSANLKAELGFDEEDVIASYLRAHDAGKHRAEALHGAARFCRVKKRYQQGFDLAKRAMKIQVPTDGLFLEEWIYQYAVLDEYAINAYWTGRYDECLHACERLLREGKIPEHMRERVAKNAAFARQQLSAKSSD